MDYLDKYIIFLILKIALIVSLPVLEFIIIELNVLGADFKTDLTRFIIFNKK